MAVRSVLRSGGLGIHRTEERLRLLMAFAASRIGGKQQKNLDNPQNLWYIVAMMAHHFWTFLAVAHVCCVLSKWPGQGQNVDLSHV